MQRLGEEDIAELPRIHLNRGSRIERTPDALRHRLVADATDPRRDLACAACLGQPNLQGLHATAQGATDKDRAKEPPIVIIDAARESRYTLLIRHRRLA